MESKFKRFNCINHNLDLYDFFASFHYRYSIFNEIHNKLNINTSNTNRQNIIYTNYFKTIVNNNLIFKKTIYDHVGINANKVFNNIKKKNSKDYVMCIYITKNNTLNISELHDTAKNVSKYSKSNTFLFVHTPFIFNSNLLCNESILPKKVLELILTPSTTIIGKTMLLRNLVEHFKYNLNYKVENE